MPSRQAKNLIGNPHRVYAIGDIHGCLDCLVELHLKIDEHLNQYPSNDVVMVYLGDYIDKGRDSKGVLDFLIDRQATTNCRFLLGNHEYLFTHFLETGQCYSQWLSWGGDKTLLSYGIEPINSNSNKVDVDAFRKLILNEIPIPHLSFLGSLLPYVKTEGYIFAHAGIRPDINLENQSIEDLVFIRSEFLNYPTTSREIIVHGHTPTNNAFERKGRVAIDSEAHKTGVLTAVIIENNTQKLIRTSIIFS